MKNNLIYICKGIPSVFDSQVLELLAEIYQNSDFRKIILLVGIKSEAEEEILKEKKINKNIELRTFLSYPNYPFYNAKIQKSLRKSILELDLNLKDCIFHVRGELTAYHLDQALPEATKKVLVDVRGASVEEVQEYFNHNIVRKWLKIYNYRRALKTLNRFEKISVVSEALKSYLVINYHLDPSKIEIIPSLAGRGFTFSKQLREHKRKELGLKENDILFVFSSGGGANWQKMDILHQLALNGYKVLNLAINKIDHPNVINRFVSYGEMPGYLNAADIALIWRDKSAVNEVASPVKFSEYVCCGLPVVANNTVVSIVEYISKFGAGKINEKFEDLNEKDFRQLVQYDRVKNSQIGGSIYSADVIADKYLEVYETF